MSKRGSRGISKNARNYLKKSYKGICQYCGGPGDTLDHIIPLSKGGPRGSTNVTLACADCNTRKGDQIYPDHITKPLLEAAEYHVVCMEFLSTMRGIRNRKKQNERELSKRKKISKSRALQQKNG